MIARPQPPFGQPPLTDPIDHLSRTELSWGKLTRVNYGTKEYDDGVFEDAWTMGITGRLRYSVLLPFFLGMFTALGKDRPARQRT